MDELGQRGQMSICKAAALITMQIMVLIIVLIIVQIIVRIIVRIMVGRGTTRAISSRP